MIGLRLWSATLKRQCCLSPEVAWDTHAWIGPPGSCRGNWWGQDDWLWLTRELGCKGIWGDSWLSVKVLTLISDVCLGQGEITAPLWFVITEMNVLPLYLVDLRKVRLHGLGLREKSSGQPADSPSAEQRVLHEKKVWPFWKTQPPSERKQGFSLHFNTSKPRTPGHS